MVVRDHRYEIALTNDKSLFTYRSHKAEKKELLTGTGNLAVVASSGFASLTYQDF